MGIQWNLVEVPLGGADQYTDAPFVVDGTVIQAQNTRWRNPPRMSKRYGYNPLSTSIVGGGTMGTGVRLIGHGKETLVAGRDTLYNYSEKLSAWASRGALSDCHVSRRGVYSAIASGGLGAYSDPGDPALDINGTVMVVAWAAAPGMVHAHVVDLENDSVTFECIPTLGGANIALVNPHVVAVGNYIYILAHRVSGGGNQIVFSRVDVTALTNFPAFAALPLTVSPDNALPLFDAAAFFTTHIFLTYKRAGANAIYLDRLAVATNVVDATTNLAKTPVSLAVQTSTGESVYWAWCNSAGSSEAEVWATDLSAGSGAVSFSASTNVARIGIGRVSSTLRVLYWETPATATDTHAGLAWRSISSAGALGTAYTCPDVVPTSKAWFYDGRLYCVVAFESTANQDTFFVVALYGSSAVLTKPKWVGTMARGLASPSNIASHLSSVAASAVGRYEIPLCTKKKFQFAGSTTYGSRTVDKDVWISRNSVARYTVDFSHLLLHSSAPWGRGRFFAGARPSWYDGVAVVEHGFAWAPESWTQTTAGAGNISNPTGPIVYAATYEHEDANGCITRSRPSPFVTIGAGLANNIVQAAFTHALTLGERPFTAGAVTLGGGARSFLYRTTDNGAQLWRAIAYMYGGEVGLLTGTPDVTMGSTASENDAAIVAYDMLYIEGDILDNAGTPPCKFCCVHGSRLWLGGLEDPTVLWFSQPYVDNEQPRFNEGLRVDVGDEVTAIIGMDGALVAFSDSDIYAVSGTGPPATGGADVGFVVSRVSTDTGCVDWRSVVLMPLGVMFRSRKGIYLLGRDFSTRWVGERVKSTLESYPNISSAVLVEDDHVVIFTAYSTGAESVRLVYHYLLDRWSVDTCAILQLSAATCWDNDVSETRYSIVGRATSLVGRESRVFDDSLPNSAFIAQQITTRWIAINTHQGWQRVRKALLLCKFADLVGGLTVEVAYDYADTYVETHTFSAAELAALGVPARGLITCVAGSALVEGETFTISDGTTSITFEFDSNAAIAPGNVAVTFSGTSTDVQMANAVALAINNVGYGVTAVVYDNTRVLLTGSASAGGNGNVVITETVANANFSVSGMSGGYDLDQVEIAFGKQECEAIKLRITDTGDEDNTAAGPALRALVFEIGMRPARAMELNPATARK